MNMQTKNTGFTLIELIIVIIILGILAVTAGPKFLDFSADAKNSSLSAMKASMEAASAFVHSKALIKGNDSLASDATSAVVAVHGTDRAIAFGYPDSVDVQLKPTADAANEIEYKAKAAWQAYLVLDPADFKVAVITVSEGNPAGVIVVYPADQTLPTTTSQATADAKDPRESCFVVYSAAAAAGTKPSFEIVNCL
jgi:prepilin-type N-terminal cleavage/methylation domain-containing protein